MNLAATLSRPFSAMAQGVVSLGQSAMRFISGAGYGFAVLLGRTSIDYMNEIGDPTRNPIVVAVVGWIARNFPEAPLRISRLNPDGSSIRVPPAGAGPGYMLRLLERPNPYYSGVLQWIATIIDLFTRGDAYWVKVRNGPGRTARVVELWWVPWWMIRPYWAPDSRRFIDYYIYTVDGVEYRIETWNVVHFRDGIDPMNQRRGLSKLASLFREIFTDDEAANFTAVLLKNFAVPGVILAPSNTGGAMGKADPEAVKKKYMETFGGDERGKVMALSAPTDVKVLSWSPEQMNLRELRRIPEERITAVLGVSAIVAGLGAGLDRSTFTNFGEARRAAYQESIIPLQRLISADLEVQLLVDFADIDAEPLDIDFDTSKASALQDALDAVWKRNLDAARAGQIKRSQFKAAIGLPSEDDDEVYLIANNIDVVPAGGNRPPGPAPRTAGALGAEVRCAGEFRGKTCGKLLAEHAVPPFRATCERCKTVTELSEEVAA